MAKSRVFHGIDKLFYHRMRIGVPSMRSASNADIPKCRLLKPRS